MTFRGNVVTWRWFSIEENLERYYYPTDFGQCCMLVPHLDLEAINFNLTSEELYFNLVADSINGDTNGLDILLDAEQFNYAYYQSNAPGFKISLHHHSDKPIIQFSSHLVNPGIKTQINIKPTIINTTIEAIKNLNNTYFIFLYFI